MKEVKSTYLFSTRNSILLLLFGWIFSIMFSGCGIKTKFLPKSVENIKKLPNEYKDIIKNLLQNCENRKEKEQLRTEISMYQNENAVKVFLKKKSKLDNIDTQTEKKLSKLSSFQRQKALKEIQNFKCISSISPTVVEIQKIIDNIEESQATENTQNQVNDEWSGRLTLYGEDRERFKNIIIAFSEKDQRKLQALFNEPQIPPKNISNFCKVFLKFNSDRERVEIINAFIYLYNWNRSLTLKICNGQIGPADKVSILCNAGKFISILQKFNSLLESAY